MNRAEVQFLLSAIYVYERRADAVGQAQVEAWYQLLGDFDVEDGKQAVLKHFASSDRPLTVNKLRADILSLRARARGDGAGRLRLPDASPDDPQAFLEALRGREWQAEREPEPAREPRERRWWMKLWGDKEENGE